MRTCLLICFALLSELSALRLPHKEKVVAADEESGAVEQDWAKQAAQELQGWGYHIPETCMTAIREHPSKGEYKRQELPGAGGNVPKIEVCKDPWYKTQQCTEAFDIPGYRIGDAFFQSKNVNYALHPFLQYFFPDSIAGKWVTKMQANKNPGYYHNNVKNPNPKTNGLREMIEVMNGPEYANWERPSSDTLVVHVRLGDVLDMQKGSYFDKKGSGEERWSTHGFLKGDDFYKQKLDLALNYTTALKKVTLITGDHLFKANANRDDIKLSKEKAQTNQEEMNKAMMHFKGLFEAKGLTATTRINYNTDCDVIYMANAHYFIQGGAGFSKLMGWLVKEKGGMVV